MRGVMVARLPKPLPAVASTRLLCLLNIRNTMKTNPQGQTFREALSDYSETMDRVARMMGKTPVRMTLKQCRRMWRCEYGSAARALSVRAKSTP